MREVTGLAPGSALDVGCGEGADAVWLALSGWTVTGVDVSATALARGAEAAASAGVEVTWLETDVAQRPPGTFDLVTMSYPALLHASGDPVAAVLGAVAPGGTLLAVFHAHVSEEHARKHGFALANYVQVDDIRARLDDGWEVLVDEERPRANPPPGAHHVDDLVLRAVRRPN